MNKRINFEDTLFLLNLRLRMLLDMLNLDSDPDVFLTITLEDIDFIDRTLTTILDELLKNDRLIERDDQLFNVEEAEEVLENFFERMTGGTGAMSQISILREKIEALKEHSRERIMRIEEVKSASDKPNTDSAMVSSDELRELLKDF